MAGRKPPSAAMLAFCAQVNDQGRADHLRSWRNVTPRKVERWTQDDLIPAPSRPSRGHGRGRAVIYEQIHVDAAVAVGALLCEERRSLDVAAVGLFLQARPISEDRIRRALLALMSAAEQELLEDARRSKAADERRDPEQILSTMREEDLAAWAEPASAERLLRSPNADLYTRAAREAGQPITATAQAIAHTTNLAMLEAVDPASDELRAISTALGIRDDVELPPTFPMPGIERLRALITSASFDDFCEARDAVRHVTPLIESLLPPASKAANILAADRDSVLNRALTVLGALDFNLRSGGQLTVLIKSNEGLPLDDFRRLITTMLE